MPGIGIRDTDRYVTVAFDAAEPSEAVMLLAVTITGAEPHDVVVEPMLGSLRNTSSTAEQAPDESAAVVELADVYSAATRAALCVETRA